MYCPVHSTWFDLPNNIWGGVQYMKFIVWTALLNKPQINTGRIYPELICHIFIHCKTYIITRNKFWEELIHLLFLHKYFWSNWK
jgi:hypothetical protein